MQIIKKEETKKEFSPKEWAKFFNKLHHSQRKELEMIDCLKIVSQKMFYGDYMIMSKSHLASFLFKRNKLVLMEFPKTN